jgi:replicative DNA helicase
MMSDLRESGSIEQDSDIIMFLLRREYYDPYDKPGHAEIIVAKNRHGQVGSIEMTYRKEFTQFANYTSAKAEHAALHDAFSAFSPK